MTYFVSRLALEQEVSRSGAVMSHLLPPLAFRPPASGNTAVGSYLRNQVRLITDPYRISQVRCNLPRAGIAA